MQPMPTGAERASVDQAQPMVPGHTLRSYGGCSKRFKKLCRERDLEMLAAALSTTAWESGTRDC